MKILIIYPSIFKITYIHINIYYIKHNYLIWKAERTMTTLWERKHVWLQTTCGKYHSVTSVWTNKQRTFIGQNIPFCNLYHPFSLAFVCYVSFGCLSQEAQLMSFQMISYITPWQQKSLTFVSIFCCFYFNFSTFEIGYIHFCHVLIALPYGLILPWCTEWVFCSTCQVSMKTWRHSLYIILSLKNISQTPQLEGAMWPFSKHLTFFIT